MKKFYCWFFQTTYPQNWQCVAKKHKMKIAKIEDLISYRLKNEKLIKCISNKKINQSVSGNTNTVYINPLNSLRFVLNKLKKDKIKLNKDFYVFTGSTVGVVPILGKGLYTGKIDKLGSAKAIIY